VYKIDLPRRVAKQLDKVAQKDYLAISKAIYNLKENPRPVACKKNTRIVLSGPGG